MASNFFKNPDQESQCSLRSRSNKRIRLDTAEQGSSSESAVVETNAEIGSSGQPSVLEPTTDAQGRIIPRLYRAHTCNENCISWTIRYIKDLKNLPAIFKPMHCAFQRNNNFKTVTGGARTTVYRAPCGLILSNLKETQAYLTTTKSELTIDCFDYDIRVDCSKELSYDKKYIKLMDITKGLEQIPIQCVNEYNWKKPNFKGYCTRRLPSSGVKINTDKNFLRCCSCTDYCQDASKCDCQELKSRYSYRRLFKPLINGIYECNEQCSCNRRCLNRVVQNPISNKLQLFHTERKGWGVRCLHDLPKGTFICTYTGEVFTKKYADQVARHRSAEYHLLLNVLDHNEGTSSYFGRKETVFVIDALNNGNIGRFFNHSCECNMFAQYVIVDTHDLRFPWIALFSKKYIPAGTELTWDYNYDIDVEPGKEVMCLCNSRSCRGRLL